MPLLKMTLTSRRQFQRIRSETQRSTPISACPHCQEALTKTRMPIKEIVVNTLCLCFLLAMFVGVWRLANTWMGQHEHRLLNHLIWREPFDNWI